MTRHRCKLIINKSWETKPRVKKGTKGGQRRKRQKIWHTDRETWGRPEKHTLTSEEEEFNEGAKKGTLPSNEERGSAERTKKK